MNTTDEDIAAYLAVAEDEELDELNRLVAEHLPDITPVLWRGTFWGGSEQAIIGYGHLTYTRSDKKTVEWFMVGLARQKSHLSLYISARGARGYLTNEYAPKLGKVKVGAGRLSFAKLGDINQEELGKLLDAVHTQLVAREHRPD